MCIRKFTTLKRIKNRSEIINKVDSPLIFSLRPYSEYLSKRRLFQVRLEGRASLRLMIMALMEQTYPFTPNISSEFTGFF